MAITTWSASTSLNVVWVRNVSGIHSPKITMISAEQVERARPLQPGEVERRRRCRRGAATVVVVVISGAPRRASVGAITAPSSVTREQLLLLDVARLDVGADAARRPRRPRRSTMTRVASRASSSVSVEHTTTAAPLAAAASTRRWMSAFEPTSTPWVGSSSTSTRGSHAQPAGHHDLLLVAARQLGDQLLRLGRAHVELADPLARLVPSPPAVRAGRRARTSTGRRSSCSRARDAPGSTACVGPFGRHAAQPGVDRRAGVAGRHDRAVDGDRPAARAAARRAGRPPPRGPSRSARRCRAPRRRPRRGRGRGTVAPSRPRTDEPRLSSPRPRPARSWAGVAATSWRPSISSTSELVATARASRTVATMRPSRRTVTRSHRPSTSSRWWEMNRMLVPLVGDAAQGARTGGRPRARAARPSARRARAAARGLPVSARARATAIGGALRLGERRRPSPPGSMSKPRRSMRRLARAGARRGGRACRRPSDRPRGRSCRRRRATSMSPRFWCTKRSPAPRAAAAEPMSNGTPGDLGDGARVGLVVAGEDLDERRLAAAVGADEGVDLAGLDRERDVAERPLRRRTSWRRGPPTAPALSLSSAVIALSPR